MSPIAFLKASSAWLASTLGTHPLWLCGHRMYWQHDRNRCRPWAVSDASFYKRWELLQDWRDLATEARAALRIAHKLSLRQLGDPDDWNLIPGPYDRMMRMFVRWDDAQWIDERSELIHETPMTDQGLLDLEMKMGQWRAEDRLRRDFVPDEDGTTWASVPWHVSREIDDQSLSFVIDDWVERGCVRLSIFRQNGKYQVRLAGGGLMGALAVQLVFEVCRTDGLAVCTSRGTLYLPATRRPRRDQNPYCLDCGIKAAGRDAAARYRLTEKYQETRRRRQDRKLAVSGEVKSKQGGENP
jgi:hypothetical protein